MKSIQPGDLTELFHIECGEPLLECGPVPMGSRMELADNHSTSASREVASSVACSEPSTSIFRRLVTFTTC